jgi:hypothetical protein
LQARSYLDDCAVPANIEITSAVEHESFGVGLNAGERVTYGIRFPAPAPILKMVPVAVLSPYRL